MALKVCQLIGRGEAPLVARVLVFAPLLACALDPSGSQSSGDLSVGENGTGSPESGTTEDSSEEDTESTGLDDEGTTGECQDLDGDGWTNCEGDCCDQVGGACAGNPEWVNPGAYEVPGNMVDDDCDMQVDEIEESCDAELASDSLSAEDFARAIDLCSFPEADPADPAERRWGVLEAKLTMADGGSAPHVLGHSIRPSFGDNISTLGGSSMAVLSSGVAADVDDVNPSYMGFEPGLDAGTSVLAPEDWIDANGGTYPNPGNCEAPWNLEANDSQMLTLSVRTPTNARSFSLGMYFMSAEYPEWVCSAFNDFFVALVDSESTANPSDKNIAVYDDGSSTWPVGVNLVSSAGGLFSICENGDVGCAGAQTIAYTDCVGAGELQGTGFDEAENGCGSTNSEQVGGGTGWLEIRGNVEPGEVMTLRLAVWDTSGHILDSLVLLDDFEWSVDAADPGVFIP
jgi:hypothetical protein